MTNTGERPLVSVIILNYNGAAWLERCLASLKQQSIFGQLEIIVADNASPDQSHLLAEKLMAGWANGRVIQHGANLGFCEGNNRAAAAATGAYFFFLNNDTWLEPDCLERLLAATRRMGAKAATPLMLNYEDDSIQSSGGAGFDLFGLMTLEKPYTAAKEVFVAGGCSYLIESTLFNKLGGFDSAFFMYADEFDLSWRVWIAGERIICDPAAKLHHRGAASVNPDGGPKVVELRTSDSKRFYANRNCLMTLLKNAQHFLLLLVPLQLLLLAAEAAVGIVLFRRWSFVRRAYIGAVASCWAHRKHILIERSRIRGYRRAGDLELLRFFRLRLNRWDEFKNMRRYGLPKVAQR